MLQDIKIFDNSILEEIKIYSNRNPKEEVCGLIYEKDKKQKIFKCSNISSNKETNFIINPEDLHFCSFRGEILAAFHSHLKNFSFSSEDIEESFKNEISYLLYLKSSDTFHFFNPEKNLYLKKYLLKSPQIHIHSKSEDLIKLFFKNEFSIDLEISLKTRDLVYDKKNFYLIQKEEKMEYYDIFILGGFENDQSKHLAIYLKNNLILHSIYSENNIIEGLSDWHLKHLEYILRCKKYIDFF